MTPPSPSPSPDQEHGNGDEHDETSHTQQPYDRENPPPQSTESPQPSETLNLEEDEEALQSTDMLDPLGDEQNQHDSYGFNALSPPQQDSLAAAVTASAARWASKQKKGAQKRRTAQERKNRMKLETLLAKIKPIPFVPTKALDFGSHEKLLRRLGLWSFVHLEFDSKVRVDLVAQLIANFNSIQRASYVNGVRILVNRADMGRALRLPPPGKKDKGAVMDGAAEQPESIAFVEDLVSNWMLLHGDMWMMPDEVLKMMNLIKEGHLEKVEWVTLIWFMVEKELMLAPNLENCYYASHLQCLIKSQREELFKEDPKLEVNVKEQEAVDDSGDAKMVDATDDFQVSELEELKIELRVGGQDNAEKDEENEHVDVNVEKYDGDKECGDEEDCSEGEDAINFEEYKGEEPVQWFLNGMNNGGEHYLQKCNLGGIKDSGFEEGPEGIGEEEEEEDDKQDDDFHLSPNALSSGNRIQALDGAQNPFGLGVQLHHHSPGDLSHMISDGSSPFGNVHKREYDNAISHSHGGLDGVNKRLRSNGPFGNKSDGFYSCMDQVQHLLGKARLVYDRKGHGFAESSMNQQVLLNELQQRDNTIHRMHNQRLAEQHKRDVHTYMLERELSMMGNLLQNYRKALKETQRAFAEYRARIPQTDEPIYKDVVGSGGLVLSTTELEKKRLKQLEEIKSNQMVIEKMLSDFAAGWTAMFNGHLDVVQLLESKLLGVDKEVGFLKELSLKGKVSTLLESAGCSSKEC